MPSAEATTDAAGARIAGPVFADVVDIRSAHAVFSSWLFDCALPFWGGVGHEGAGLGAREHLRLDGSSAGAPYKRMRVQARQIYVFSQAAIMGWPEGERLARQGYDFVCAHGERRDGGWARRLSPTGEVLDGAVDLYDQAFVLFGFAWFIRASGSVDARNRARRTTEWIREHMPTPPGGYHNVIPIEIGPRQQNPHMHLLEATLALYETTGDNYYATFAHELVDLFRRYFFDTVTGTLGEFFAHDWSPASGAAGDHVEPGHHYEWVWLLDQYEHLTGATASEEIDRLYRFARRYGADPTSALVWDVVGRDGSIRSRSTRLWPQTEALKAHAVMARRTGEGADQACLAVRNLFTRFFRQCPVGAWVDQFDAAGDPATDRIPTSSLYHVLMGYAELDLLTSAMAGQSNAGS